MRAGGGFVQVVLVSFRSEVTKLEAVANTYGKETMRSFVE